MDLEKSAQIWRDILKRSDLTPEDRVALRGTIDEIIPVLSRLGIETDPFRLIEGREAAMVLEEAAEIGKTKPEEEKEQEAAKKPKARKSHQTPHIGIKSILQTPIEEEGVEAQTPKTRFEQLQQAGKTINKGDETWGWKEVVPVEYEKGVQKPPQTEMPTPAPAAPVQAAPRGAGIVGGINRAARGVGRRRIRFSRRRRRGVGGAASTAQAIVKDAKRLRAVIVLINVMIAAIPFIAIFVFIIVIIASICTLPGLNFIASALGMPCNSAPATPPPTTTCEGNGKVCRSHACAADEEETGGTCPSDLADAKCCIPKSGPGPIPIPNCGEIVDALSDKFGIHLKEGAPPSWVYGGTYPAETLNCTAEKGIYKTFAIATQSDKYKRKITSGDFTMQFFQGDLGGLTTGGDLMQLQDAVKRYNLYDFNSSYFYIPATWITHESGHIIEQRNSSFENKFRDFLSWAVHSDQSNDKDCYVYRSWQGGWVLKTYSNTSSGNHVRESFAEAIALFVYNHKETSYGSISNFKTLCPATYRWTRDNIYDYDFN